MPLADKVKLRVEKRAACLVFVTHCPFFTSASAHNINRLKHNLVPSIGACVVVLSFNVCFGQGGFLCKQCNFLSPLDDFNIVASGHHVNNNQQLYRFKPIRSGFFVEFVKTLSKPRL